MREDTLLNLRLTTKEELTDNEKVGKSLSCSEHEMVVFGILRGGEKSKNQDHNHGLQEGRLWPVQLLGRIIWLTVLERSQGGLADFQGSPPPTSTVVSLNMQKVKQRLQETCMDEELGSDKIQT